jgi:hypothetical protein
MYEFGLTLPGTRLSFGWSADEAKTVETSTKRPKLSRMMDGEELVLG